MLRPFMILCMILSVFGTSVLATVSSSEDKTVEIPPALKQNCILRPDGLIDTCPVYRQVMRTRNRSLAQQRQQALDISPETLSTLLQQQIANQKKDKLNLLKNTPTTDTAVMIDYEQYIVRRFRDYLAVTSSPSQAIRSFFSTTYFDEDQSGLGISKISLFRTIPNQYDDNIIAQISIRNYTTSSMDQIEDIYCFATIDGEDYIFPLGVQSILPKNSITNIVTSIPTKSSPFLDNYGEKSLYCMLVYTQDNIEKYTNR